MGRTWFNNEPMPVSPQVAERQKREHEERCARDLVNLLIKLTDSDELIWEYEADMGRYARLQAFCKGQRFILSSDHLLFIGADGSGAIEASRLRDAVFFQRDRTVERNQREFVAASNAAARAVLEKIR